MDVSSWLKFTSKHRCCCTYERLKGEKNTHTKNMIAYTMEKVDCLAHWTAARHTDVHVYTCMHACAHTYALTCKLIACTCTHTHTTCMHTCIGKCAHVYTHPHTHTPHHPLTLHERSYRITICDTLDMLLCPSTTKTPLCVRQHGKMAQVIFWNFSGQAKNIFSCKWMESVWGKKVQVCAFWTLNSNLI